MGCHPDRCGAKWRDLRFSPPATNPNGSTTLPFVIPSEAEGSAVLQARPGGFRELHAPFRKRKAHTLTCPVQYGRKSGFAPVGMTIHIRVGMRVPKKNCHPKIKSQPSLSGLARNSLVLANIFTRGPPGSPSPASSVPQYNDAHMTPQRILLPRHWPRVLPNRPVHHPQRRCREDWSEKHSRPHRWV